MLEPKTNDESFLALTPRHVADEIRVVLLLREELRNTHEDYDGEASPSPPVEPVYRTVDAEALRVLKCPSYPFIVCEEAPPSYRAPIPYKLDTVLETMRGQLRALESRLQAEGVTQQSASGRFFSSVDRHDMSSEINHEINGGTDTREQSVSRSVEPTQVFTNVLRGDASFAEVSVGVSVLRWYTRWVVSHSERCLEDALEQVEYVLAEGPLTTEEELIEGLERFSFVEAVSRLEKDRSEVIEAERRRMLSHTRAFRERLSPLAITAANSSFLTVEEKYRYQECYNHSEHSLMLFNHALHAQRTSQNQKVPFQSSKEFPVMGTGHKLVSSFLAPVEAEDAKNDRSLSDSLMRAFRHEREVITELLQKIHERQKRNVVLGVAGEEYRMSRLAAMVVFKCLVDDIAMHRQRVRLATQFLVEFDSWILDRCGMGHESLVMHLGLSAENDEPHMNVINANLEQNPVAAHTCDDPLDSESSCLPVQLPRHTEEVCEVLMALLSQAGASLDLDGSSAVSETVYRRWMCLSLRHTCMQIVRGKWPSDLLFASMDDITKSLFCFVSTYSSKLGAVQSHVAELSAVLRCFLCLVLDGAAMQRTKKDVSETRSGTTSAAASNSGALPASATARRDIRIPVAFQLDSDTSTIEESVTMSDEDENVWGTFFDALWFQVDPTGCAHGGFLLLKGLPVDARNEFGFLCLDSITFPERVPKARRGAGYSPKVYLTLHYSFRSANMSPARSLAQIAEETPTMPFSSIVTRYSYTRRVLYILSILEQRQLLQDYACCKEEVELVPLESAIYFSRKREDSHMSLDQVLCSHGAPPPPRGDCAATRRRMFTIVVGLLPPAAVQLLRYNAIPTGAQYPVSRRGKISPTTPRQLVGGMLTRLAAGGTHKLSEMHAAGGMMCDWEAETGAAKTGNGVNGDKKGDCGGSSSRSPVMHVLNILDDYISSAAFEKVMEQADDEVSR